MAYGLVLVFEGVTEEQYWAVNEQLGLAHDRDWSGGDVPDGLKSHFGGPTATGLVVSEVWESKGHQEAFMASRLGPALGAVGLPAPAQIIETETANYQTPG